MAGARTNLAGASRLLRRTCDSARNVPGTELLHASDAHLPARIHLRRPMLLPPRRTAGEGNYHQSADHRPKLVAEYYRQQQSSTAASGHGVNGHGRRESPTQPCPERCGQPESSAVGSTSRLISNTSHPGSAERRTNPLLDRIQLLAFGKNLRIWQTWGLLVSVRCPSR